MTDRMPTVSCEMLEATLTLRQVGNQVFMELDGDCWSANVTPTDEAITTLNDWLTLYRMQSQ